MRKRATVVLIAALAPMLLGASSAQSSAHPSSAHTARAAPFSSQNQCHVVSWQMRHVSATKHSPSSG
jgi:hypothetical protein